MYELVEMGVLNRRLRGVAKTCFNKMSLLMTTSGRRLRSSEAIRTLAVASQGTSKIRFIAFSPLISLGV